MASKIWSARIQPNSMGERLVLSILIVIAFLSLGLQLRSGPMWDWVVTVAAMMLMALVSNPLRGTRLDLTRRHADESSSPFWQLIDLLMAHPVWRFLASNFALRTISALVFAVVVASTEQSLLAAMFGPSPGDPRLAGLVSLLVVLSPVFIALGYLRRNQEPSAWNSRFIELLAELFRMRPRDIPKNWKPVISGVAKALATVGVRALALIAMPWFFSSWYGVAFIGTLALAFLLGGETIIDALRKLDRLGQGNAPNTDDNSDPNPNGRYAP